MSGSNAGATDAMASDVAIIESIAKAYYEESLLRGRQQTDFLFCVLLLAEWAFCLLLAMVVTPLTWTGERSSVHLHVYAAVVLGGATALFPLVLYRSQSGTWLMRHVVAVAQMVFSGLIIHLTHGRIESHFHVFGSLAFLTFYRDWKVLATATLVTAGDHFLRGIFWPVSIYGELPVSDSWLMREEIWRTLEHAGWVIFADVFSIVSVQRQLKELWQASVQHAKLQLFGESVQREVVKRTEELKSKTEQIETILDTLPQSIFTIDSLGNIGSGNRAFQEFFGGRGNESEDVESSMLLRKFAPQAWKEFTRNFLATSLKGKCVAHYDDSIRIPVEYQVVQLPVDSRSGKHSRWTHVVVLRDISEERRSARKRRELQRRLIDAARKAGKAEIANGVLHNVGNVLNSLNTGTGVILDVLRSSRRKGLTKLSALLQEQESRLGEFFTSDPRGEKVPEFVSQLDGELEKEQREVQQRMEEIKRHVEHIKSIISIQQSMSKSGGTKEFLPLSGVLKDAIEFNRARLARHGVQLEIVGDQERCVLVDRGKVSQILVNLIKNSIEAFPEEQSEGRRIELLLECEAEETNPTVAVRVRDNGCGIPPEGMKRMFSQGFTSKKSGHGFGLHCCLLMAREMDGDLKVESAGVGRGATFTLSWPLMLKEGARKGNEVLK